MKTIPLTRGMVAIVDDVDYEKVINIGRWYACKKGRCNFYARRHLTRVRTETMHRFIIGDIEGKEIDHINGNGLDNRRENLRHCNHHENIANSRKSIDNTSGFRGVSFDKSRAKWSARIGTNGKQRFLGRFSTAEDAARSYDAAAIKYFGEFANINFILA